MIRNYLLLAFDFKDNFFSKKIFDYGDSTPLKIFKEQNEEVLICGNPFTNNSINIEKLYKNLKEKKFSKEFIKSIDGEFLIIKVNYKNKDVTIYNSRFASPPVYFYFVDQFLIISNNFYKIASYLKKNLKFELDQNNLWHFFKFRRIFGYGTLDKNTKYLKPSQIMRVNKDGISAEKYWEPKYHKNTLTLRENAKILSENIEQSWRNLLSDKEKPALFLSGGLDTRTYLAHCPKKLKCINLTYVKNRESEAAEKSCKITNQNFYWRELQQGIYPKYLEKSSCVNSSMYIMDAIFYGHDEILNDVDVIFSGYGIDWFFQGWYLPFKTFTFGKHKLYLRFLKNIKGDLVEFFINNFVGISKGFEPEKIVKENYLKEINDDLINTLNDLDGEIKNSTDNLYDRYENLAFGNISRHYTYGAISALKEYKEHRVLAFTNNIYDHYFNVPFKQRIEGRVEKEALKIKKPELLEIPSGNTGFKLKYGSKMLTIMSGLKFIKQNFKSGVSKKIERTWLPLDDLIRKEFRKEINELKYFDELDKIKFLDRDKLNKYIDSLDHSENPGHILMLLLTFKSFIKNL